MAKPLPTDRAITYQYQYRRCGSGGCHCATGAQHGPYWFAYWRDDRGRVHSRYIGKALPDRGASA